MGAEERVDKRKFYLCGDQKSNLKCEAVLVELELACRKSGFVPQYHIRGHVIHTHL